MKPQGTNRTPPTAQSLIPLTTQKPLGTVPSNLHVDPVDMNSYVLWRWKTTSLDTQEKKVGVGEIILLRLPWAGLTCQSTSNCKFYFGSKAACDRESQGTCVDLLKEEVNVRWSNWFQSSYESGRKTPNKYHKRYNSKKVKTQVRYLTSTHAHPPSPMYKLKLSFIKFVKIVS